MVNAPKKTDRWHLSSALIIFFRSASYVMEIIEDPIGIILVDQKWGELR